MFLPSPCDVVRVRQAAYCLGCAGGFSLQALAASIQPNQHTYNQGVAVCSRALYTALLLAHT